MSIRPKLAYRRAAHAAISICARAATADINNINDKAGDNHVQYLLGFCLAFSCLAWRGTAEMGILLRH